MQGDVDPRGRAHDAGAGRTCVRHAQESAAHLPGPDLDVAPCVRERAGGDEGATSASLALSL